VTSWEGRSEGCQVDTVPTVRLLQMPTFAAVIFESTTEWPRSSGTDVATVQLRVTVNSDLSLTWWLRERPVITDLTLTPRLSQPVIVYTLSLTSRLQPCAAVFDTFPDATLRPVLTSPVFLSCQLPRRHLPTMTILCRHRKLAMPPGYIAYIF